jgi:hypothetical protein
MCSRSTDPVPTGEIPTGILKPGAILPETRFGHGQSRFYRPFCRANAMATLSKSRRSRGDVSSNFHTALSRNDWHYDWRSDLAHDLQPQCVQGDPNIDDPVNDTGLGLRCGDFQVSGGFAGS